MNHKFEIIIYWTEPEKCYIAEVPELAGCKADGKTYQEAISNVQVIMDEWIETAKSLGRIIPTASHKLIYGS